MEGIKMNDKDLSTYNQIRMQSKEELGLTELC